MIVGGVELAPACHHAESYEDEAAAVRAARGFTRGLKLRADQCLTCGCWILRRRFRGRR